MGDKEGAFSGPAGAVKRPRFDTGDSLAAVDLVSEQEWRVQRLRRHARHLHGWGIVCGLWVAPALDPSRPWGLVVCPGYAIGPYGDEIQVSCRAPVDLRDWIWSQPSPKSTHAFVVIRYLQTAGAPRSHRTAECDCDERRTRPSRLADSRRIEVLWDLPSAIPPMKTDICAGEAPGCAPCPPDPHVTLARVQLPGDEGTWVVAADIDCSVRRMLL
jgi:hypothetical protein